MTWLAGNEIRLKCHVWLGQNINPLGLSMVFTIWGTIFFFFYKLLSRQRFAFTNFFNRTQHLYIINNVAQFDRPNSITQEVTQNSLSTVPRFQTRLLFSSHLNMDFWPLHKINKPLPTPPRTLVFLKNPCYPNSNVNTICEWEGVCDGTFMRPNVP